MKNGKYIIGCLTAIALLLVACSGDNQKPYRMSADLLKVGSSVEVSGGASKDTIGIEANCEWKVTAETSWIHIISPKDGIGNGNQSLIIDVDASPLSTTRSGKLTMLSSDGIECSIDVTQRAGDVILISTPQTLTFTYEGGDQTLNITSNTKWTATSNSSWLTINGESSFTAEGNQELTIHANPNNNSGNITGTIVFNDQDERISPVSVTVTVGGRTPFLQVIEPDDMPAAGGTTNLGVHSNFNWTITLSPNPRGKWVYFEDEEKRQIFSGSANDKELNVGIFFEPNSTETERVINIVVETISEGGNNLTKECTITQAAGKRPTISNVACSNVKHNAATITFQQSYDTFGITECGVYYSTSEADVQNGANETGTLKGTATVNLTNLMPNTVYYVKAYATNAVGTKYSDGVISFKTLNVPGRDDNEKPEVE